MTEIHQNRMRLFTRQMWSRVMSTPWIWIKKFTVQLGVENHKYHFTISLWLIGPRFAAFPRWSRMPSLIAFCSTDNDDDDSGQSRGFQVVASRDFFLREPFTSNWFSSYALLYYPAAANAPPQAFNFFWWVNTSSWSSAQCKPSHTWKRSKNCKTAQFFDLRRPLQCNVEAPSQRIHWQTISLLALLDVRLDR